MSEPATTRRPRSALVAIALLAVAGIAVFWAVYGINPGPGNVAGGQSCEGAHRVAELLDQRAVGQLAAFQVSEDPKPVPEIAFADGEGNALKISDWRGRTVLLNLWATWCAPCRHEMPALDALQERLGGPDFEMVAVSVDRGEPDKPKAFFEEIGIESLNFYADGTTDIFTELKQAGLAFGMPSTVLIDKNGCTLGVLNGPAEWASPDAFDLIATAINPPA